MFCFRVDGNADIGSGHIMRCLSLADAFKREGQASLFILASGDFYETVKDYGHESIIIDFDHSKMESDNIIPIVNRYMPSMVIVDSYQVNGLFMQKLYSQLKDAGIELAYFDDRYEYPYTCDQLINYNIFADSERYRELYKGMKIPRLLLGPSYAPLRYEFTILSDKGINPVANRVFVSTGGADTEHFMIDLIRSAKNSKLNYTFVVGAMNRDKEKIRNISSGNDNITIKENVKCISELMRSSEIAISAAGSTLYELCATQTPTITYIVSDNQIPAAEAFEKNKIMINCGDVRKAEKEAFADKLIKNAEKLSKDYDERKRMAELMRKLIDRKGAENLAKKLI